MIDKPTVFIGFTASSGILGNVIRWASQSDVSHAFLAWDDPWFETRMTLGANHNGVTMQPISRMALDKPTLWKGPLDLWPAMIKHIDLINAPYAYSTLFNMAVIEAERHLLLRAGNDAVQQAKVICSEYVALIGREAGYNLLPGMPAGTIDPGQLETWVRGAGFKVAS